MLTILFGLLQITQPTVAPIHHEKSIYQIQAVVYQGSPDGSNNKGDLNIISRPQLLVKDGQMAQVQVGQVVPIATDIHTRNPNIPNDVTIKALESEQLGVFMRMTATENIGGRIYLQTYVQLKELVKGDEGNDSVLERTIKDRRMCKLGEKVTVPLYNPND